MTQLLGARTVNESWNAFGATTTKVLVIESREPVGGVAAMFDVRLRYGIEGIESAIYSESITVYLEPSNARIVDFRQRLGDDLGSVTNVGGLTVECRVNYGYPPIQLQMFEVDLERADRLFFLAGLDGKADFDHTHSIESIPGLYFALDKKLNPPNASSTAGWVLAASGIGNDLVWVNPDTFGGGGGATTIEQVSGLAARLLGLDGAIAARIPADIIGDPGGVAELDTSGQVPIAQLPTLPIAKISPTGATAGQVLGVSGGVIAWVTPSATLSWNRRNANGTLAQNENCLAVDGATQLTLPAATSGVVQIANASSSTATVLPNAGAMIGGSTRVLLPTKGVIQIFLEATTHQFTGDGIAEETETSTLFSALTGTYSLARRIAANSLIKSLKDAGYWSVIDRLFIFAAPNGSTDGLRDWKNPTRTASVSGTNTPVTWVNDRGFTGNGSTGFVDTNYNPSTETGDNLTASSAFLGVWSRTDSQAAVGDATLGSDGNWVVGGRWADGRFIGRMGDGSGASDGGTSTSSRGFIAARRNGTSVTGRLNLTQTLSAAPAVGTLPNATVRIGASSAISNFSTRQYAAAIVGSAPTDSQWDAVYNALNSYLSSIGAN